MKRKIRGLLVSAFTPHSSLLTPHFQSGGVFFRSVQITERDEFGVRVGQFFRFDHACRDSLEQVRHAEISRREHRANRGQRLDAIRRRQRVEVTVDAGNGCKCLLPLPLRERVAARRGRVRGESLHRPREDFPCLLLCPLPRGERERGAVRTRGARTPLAKTARRTTTGTPRRTAIPAPPDPRPGRRAALFPPTRPLRFRLHVEAAARPDPAPRPPQLAPRPHTQSARRAKAGTRRRTGATLSAVPSARTARHTARFRRGAWFVLRFDGFRKRNGPRARRARGPR